MLKFYKIPESILISQYMEIIVWLDALPKTKRGKAPFIFGRVIPGTIAFTWKRDATAFAIKFSARPINDDDKRKYYRMG